MADRTLDWRDELGRWLEPFLARLATRRGDRCVRSTCRVGEIILKAVHRRTAWLRM